jgi:NAD(P)-dependent dehydrogenase (short-subunit alcohol dehydrogenase family)
VAGKRDFEGRIAVVTGAGSGIGRATATLLARLGAKVHAADLAGDAAAATVAEIRRAGGRGVDHAVDVTDSEQVERLAARVYAEDGRVDVLHNNAGIGGAGPIELTTLGDWRAIVEVNLMGVVHGVHWFVPRMLEQGGGGHIVNTASMLGLVPGPGVVPYSTTKHAVVGLSESLNAELSPRGIRVTALCPGIINTPIVTASSMTGEMAEKREQIKRFYERFGATADDVAEAAVDAIRRGALIRTVPRSHVVPTWLARRLTPRAAQPLARLSERLIMRD